ncbi:MAG: zinc-dependent metalloprotease [Actinomycetota bacterium]|nr:zinc-dependent metalloprotease [Actinomycetota bacterium]
MDDIDRADLLSALAEVPLFREVRNVLVNQVGPVNWDIAGQIASAVARSGGTDYAGTSEKLAALKEAFRVAELRLTSVTGFELLPGIVEVEALSRSGWARANLQSYRPYIERLATHLAGQISTGPGVPVAALVTALGPLLMGTQMGLTLGYLAHKSLAHWDVCLPRGRSGHLYINEPNVGRLERELGIDPKQLRLWIALHEVSHELLFQAVSWTRPHFVGLVESYIDAASMDSSEILGRLQGASDPEEIARLMQQPEELFPMLRSPAQHEFVERIQAFMGVAEGYSEWIVQRAGTELLGDFDKIREGINRRRAERSSAEKMLEKLLGLDLTLEQQRAGERFISRAAHAGQLELLWKGPENLPTLLELAEPAKWLTRVAFS